MSKQKKLIYGIVLATMSHPTADWVYEKARQKMPRISLGTVYRNLKLLTAEGLLLEISTARGPVRYDANVSRHSHLRCVQCDRLEDVPESEMVLEPKSRLRKFKILEYRVELIGICPTCRDYQSNSKN